MRTYYEVKVWNGINSYLCPDLITARRVLGALLHEAEDKHPNQKITLNGDMFYYYTTVGHHKIEVSITPITVYDTLPKFLKVYDPWRKRTLREFVNERDGVAL